MRPDARGTLAEMVKSRRRRPSSHPGSLKTATRPLRRRLLFSAAPPWQGLILSLALLGLFLLPCDYRAGASSSHAHSIIQLWLDAADGSVQHPHHPATDLLSASGSWFDPKFGEMDKGHAGIAQDVGDQEKSAPASVGFDLLLFAFAAVFIAPSRQSPTPVPTRPLAGRTPGVLSPPPRWTPAAA